MKYRDLSTTEELNCEDMRKIVGGLTTGEFVSADVPGIGAANTPLILAGEQATGTTSLGGLIHFVSNDLGLAGANALKSVVGINLPRGLS